MRGDPNWAQRAPNFIIRKLSDIDVKQAETGTWESRRYLTRKDDFGFSFHHTVLRAGQSTHIHYKNHVEAVLVTSGSGSIELVEDGQAEGDGFALFRLEPGSFYGLGGQDNHYLRADPEEDMHVACAFNPPVDGSEDHDEHGVYPAIGADGVKRYGFHRGDNGGLFKVPSVFANGSLPWTSPLPCTLNLSTKNPTRKSQSGLGQGEGPQQNRRNYQIRLVKPGDGLSMWQICKEVGMDENSPYLYNLFCNYFADSCVLAIDEWSGNPVGYMLGFVPPERRDTYFVWQIGAVRSTQGNGLAHHLLERAVAHCGSTHVEASVTPSNVASNKFFQKFAKRRNASWTLDENWMPAEHFPAVSKENHEREALYRIGPFAPGVLP